MGSSRDGNALRMPGEISVITTKKTTKAKVSANLSKSPIARSGSLKSKQSAEKTTKSTPKPHRAKDGAGLIKDPVMPREDRPADYAGVGAPSKYKPEYCAQVIELGKAGKSVVQMAVSIGVPRETLMNWADAHTEFFNALSYARNCSQDWWETQAQNGLVMPQGSGTFQANVWSKSMSARFPDDYTDKTKTELTGKNGGAIKVSRIELIPLTNDDSAD